MLAMQFANGALPRRSSKLRTIAIALVVGSFAFIAAAIFLVSLSRRESLPPINLADVDAASQRWTEHGPTNYDLDLEQTASIQVAFMLKFARAKSRL